MVRDNELTRFFENSEIFVTGGSGVVGKALIDKLLRSCNVRRIYVLLRPKREMNAERRLAKMRQAKIFQMLHSQKPNEMDKLTAIPGDVSHRGLGIDEQHLEMLQRVSIVFHCAATVRFDEPLRVALRLNVGGTLEAIKFAERLQHLRIFVHVSTFFSNPYLKHVENKHYSSPMDWRLCLRLLDEVEDPKMLDALTRKMIVGFPNTYTFTKNLAESLVNDYHTRLPVIVYRPSVVLFSLEDPVPGFAPSLMGAMGLFALVGGGLLKTVYLSDTTQLDITPHDLSTKVLCYYTMAGYKKYQEGPPKDLLVYQMSSYKLIPFSFKSICERMKVKDHWAKVPFLKSLSPPTCHYTQNRFVYKFIVFTRQLLPALLVDLLLQLFGKPPALMAIARKAYQTLEVMQPFLFNNYESTGPSDLDALLDSTADTEFDLHVDFYTPTTWEEIDRHVCSMLLSIRHDILKEDPRTLERAKLILKIKIIISNLFSFFLLYKLLDWLLHRILA